MSVTFKTKEDPLFFMGVWKCGFCEKEFDTKDKWEKHEIFCKSQFENKIEKIFVKKGNRFIGEGIILFFIGSILIFLFEKSGIIIKFVISFGGILIVLGITINLFGEERLEFRCNDCGKRFVRKRNAIKHLKKCKI